MALEQKDGLTLITNGEHVRVAMPQGRVNGFSPHNLWQGENKMRLPTKSGFAMAPILAASLGFAGLTQAAPLGGVAAAVPAVQTTQAPSAAEALPEKAFHHGYKHRRYYKPVYKHRKHR